MPRFRCVPLLLVMGLSVYALNCKNSHGTHPVPAVASVSMSVAAPTAAPSPADAGGLAPTVIDLLHSVPCVVAVSSKVDNPKDFPEHLVDGKNETAWNSKTGDLKGFIAFRTPKVTRVKRIELTVGFDKTGKLGDLFTMNHRITKVRLTRQGALLKEADLDPEQRALQGFDIDEEGGDFKLEVLSTLPGSKKEWQELTVSEFRVMGLANGAPENPTHLPAMAIGNLDGTTPRETLAGEPPLGPFPSVNDLCAAYDKAMAPLIKRAFPGTRYPGTIDAPHCAPWKHVPESRVVAEVAQGPFLGGQFVYLHDTEQGRARLVLQTDKGFSLTNVTIYSRYLDDPGCGHAGDSAFVGAKLAVGSLGRPSLIVRVANTDVYWLGSTEPSGTIERAYACVADAQGAVACDGPLITGRSSGVPDGWVIGSGPYGAVDLAKLPWDFRKEPVLGPAGDLRLTP